MRDVCQGHALCLAVPRPGAASPGFTGFVRFRGGLPGNSTCVWGAGTPRFPSPGPLPLEARAVFLGAPPQPSPELPRSRAPTKRHPGTNEGGMGSLRESPVAASPRPCLRTSPCRMTVHTAFQAGKPALRKGREPAGVALGVAPWTTWGSDPVRLVNPEAPFFVPLRGLASHWLKTPRVDTPLFLRALWEDDLPARVLHGCPACDSFCSSLIAPWVRP